MAPQQSGETQKSDEMPGAPEHGGKLGLRDALLMALAMSSGAIDSVSFLALGKVFTAFMTGNIAFLGLAIAGAPGPNISMVLVAFFAFGVGVYIASKLLLRFRSLDTWPRQVTVVLGLSLIPQALFAVLWAVKPHALSSSDTDALVALWALAMGMQSAAARRLNVAGVFTTAATATIIHLAGDFAGWKVQAGERTRLAGVILMLLLGAVCGGLLLLHARPYAPLFPLTITAAVWLTAATRFHAAT
jgi:uncharacterized membrane protein YoaK (UPF0700 family)